jgi:hypothetical protein
MVTTLIRASFDCITLDSSALICFRKHCALFPNMRALPGQAVNCLQDFISYAYSGMVLHATFGHVMSSLADLIMSQTSVFCFDLDELSNMLSVVDRVKGQLLSSIVYGIHLDQTQTTSKRSTNTLSVLSV